MADITRIRGITTPPVPDPISGLQKTGSPASPPAASGAAPTFSELLRARQGVAGAAPLPPPSGPEVRFSAHAQTRIESRQIKLDEAHMDRLKGAVQKAASKGSRDALVLMDDFAMVVSVTNRTVVTVVDKENLKQNVFTNIDSAVIA